MIEKAATTARTVNSVIVLTFILVTGALAQESEIQNTDGELPTVLLLATGGTIAGVQEDPDDPERYRAGSLTAEEIIASVPELQQYANVEYLQFSNKPSPQITPADWVNLSKEISGQLNTRDELAGVVVTHGTDRMEESAFFLHLTVESDKPVILVGAQRPATHRSPDGPANLLAAVRTAVNPDARDRGVMIVMDERILSAREVRKDYPRVGGFATGRIGLVGHDGPEFLYRPSRPHTHLSELKLSNIDSLPEVDIAFSYPGGSGPNYDSLPAGIVVTTTASSCNVSLSLQELARQGVHIVSAFPTGQSVRRMMEPVESAPDWVRESCPEFADDPRWEGAWTWSIPARLLTPQKARILLMLALAQTDVRSEIERILLTY